MWQGLERLRDAERSSWRPMGRGAPTPMPHSMATPGSTLTNEQRQREDDLVRRHLPLVGYAVAEMVNKVPRHVSRADLESAGMEGLAQAARSFDPARGIAFDRYASNRIRSEEHTSELQSHVNLVCR